MSITRKKKVYATTVETSPFSFFRVWGSMVYTLLSGPMVYTLFPCFPRKMVYTIACFALWPRGRATDGEKRGPAVVVYTLFPLNQFDCQNRRHLLTTGRWGKQHVVYVFLAPTFSLFFSSSWGSFRTLFGVECLKSPNDPRNLKKTASTGLKEHSFGVWMQPFCLQLEASCLPSPLPLVPLSPPFHFPLPPFPSLLAETSPKFGSSTGNTFWQFSGIF